VGFTDRTIKALTPKAQPYRVLEQASDKGFCVQVLRTGAKTFEQQYTLHGHRRFMRLGTFFMPRCARNDRRETSVPLETLAVQRMTSSI
jgi:hypothetical protein